MMSKIQKDKIPADSCNECSRKKVCSHVGVIEESSYAPNLPLEWLGHIRCCEFRPKSNKWRK
jgi:hypothetical protein